MTDDWLNKRQNERLKYKENMLSNECVCEELSKRFIFVLLNTIMMFLDKYLQIYRFICIVRSKLSLVQKPLLNENN
jgi:hypothetical protein